HFQQSHTAPQSMSGAGVAKQGCGGSRNRAHAADRQHWEAFSGLCQAQPHDRHSKVSPRLAKSRACSIATGTYAATCSALNGVTGGVTELSGDAEIRPVAGFITIQAELGRRMLARDRRSVVNK